MYANCQSPSKCTKCVSDSIVHNSIVPLPLLVGERQAILLYDDRESRLLYNMRQHFDLYRIAIVHVGDFDRLPTANLAEIHARPSHVSTYFSLEQQQHIRHRGARQLGRNNSDETYLRFSLLNSFSRNLVKCSLPTGSFKSSCKLNAHRRTRFNWISFLFNPTTSKMIKQLVKYIIKRHERNKRSQ